MAFNMIKPALPKIASTIGLSGLSAGVSHGIIKALNKKKNLEIDEKTMNQIKQNFKKINDSKVFDRKVTVNQKGSGIFSFLLPILASTIIPSLISGKGVSKNRNFFEVKSKYPSLFERKNYPLSNIFINDLLKNFKHFEGCYSKDQIPLIENIKSLIFNLQNSDQKGSHWVSLSRKNDDIFIFDSFGVGHIPNNLYKIYKNYNIIYSGRSCLTQLLSHIDDIVQGLASGVDTDAIYLDFAKAFDKVDHRLLLLKMDKLGFHEKVTK